MDELNDSLEKVCYFGFFCMCYNLLTSCTTENLLSSLVSQPSFRLLDTYYLFV